MVEENTSATPLLLTAGLHLTEQLLTYGPHLENYYSPGENRTIEDYQPKQWRPMDSGSLSLPNILLYICRSLIVVVVAIYLSKGNSHSHKSNSYLHCELLPRQKCEEPEDVAEAGDPPIVHGVFLSYGRPGY